MISVNAALTIFNQMHSSHQLTINLTQVINQNYQQINQTLSRQHAILKQSSSAVNEAAQNQQRLNKEMQKGGEQAKKLLKKMKEVGQAILKGAKFVAGVSDEYIRVQANLSLINDGSQTMEELQSKIFAAAERSRVPYSDLADSIHRLGSAASHAFTSNDEMIAMAELTQQAFRLGGASSSEQQAGMKLISQAMATGNLQKDGFQQILQQAPMIAEALAQFTGQSTENLMKMASDGMLTADLLKNALFAAGDEINEKFGTLPLTFGEVGTQLSNRALKAFGPVFERINQMLNSPEVQRFIAWISLALDGVASLLGYILDNWTVVEFILAAIGSVYLGVIISKLWAMIPPLLMKAAAWLSAYWPILLIVAAIGLVLLVLSRLGITADQVLGFVGALFGTLYAVVYNVIAGMWNRIAAFVEFFANVFNHPVYSIKKLFVNLLNTILDFVKTAAEAIDWVFGSNLADGITDFQGRLEDWLGEQPEGYKVIERMQFKDVKEAASKGYQLGVDFVGEINAALDKFSLHSIGSEFNPSVDLDIKNINRVNEVAKVGGTVDISSEDIKMMRELAEQQWVQNNITLTPHITFGDTHVRNESDIDTIISRIETFMEEQRAASISGVYEI